MTNLEFDFTYYNNGINYLCGIDEAGRGPVAGPVVAAAVVFSKYISIEGITDSKKITAKQREKLFDVITNKALTYGIGIVGVEEIEEINILQATFKAMKQALNNLSIKPDFVLIDGNLKFENNLPTEAITKGDSKSFVIGAASIIAKVTRDRIMLNLSKEFPNYYWEKNKGYGTKQHFEAIRKYGLTPHHRKSFLKNLF